MSRCYVDHLTVTAPSLEAGAEFVLQTLGVAPQAGGEHPRMGTHNLLLRLGEALFLEVISPNPRVPAPERPRWFALARKSSKPRTQKTLLSTLHALFKKELSEQQLQQLFASLCSRGVVKVEGTKVSYALPIES